MSWRRVSIRLERMHRRAGSKEQHRECRAPHTVVYGDKEAVCTDLEAIAVDRFGNYSPEYS